MDPVSFSASLLTLIAGAGNSCKFLYELFLDISDAPFEIRSQAVKLRSLHQTISNLARVYESGDLPPDLRLDPVLQRNIFQFVEEIKTIESKIQGTGNMLDRGRVRHIWERFKWLLSDRELHKFYTSLDNWNTVFSNAVAVTGLKLLMRILKNTELPISAPPPAMCAEYTAPCSNYVLDSMQSHQSHAQCFETSLSHKKQQFTASKIATTSETALPKRLSIYLSSISEPVGFRVQRWRTFGGGLLSADLRTGPVIVRCWSENGQDIYKLLPSREAFCFSFQIRLVQIVPSKVLISISALYKASFPFRTRFQWDLSISAMLHTDSCAYLASKRGDWLLLRQLLADGKVRISDTTAHGDTLLHIAAQSNHYELATELLSAGADVNVANDFGQTPLHKAVKNNGGYEVSRHLLSSGADLSRQDLAGRTPLHCFFNETSRQIIQFHQEDLDSTTQDYRGMNIMHYVSWSKSSRPTDILRCLTDQPPSLASTDQEGRTILHLSLQRGNLELIEFLLDQPDTATFRPDWRGRTLLHYATESRRTQTIDILLRRGFNLHAVDLDGRTVLHHAAAKDKLDAVKRLLELGAASDLVALDKGSRTPLQVAALCDAQAVVQYLQPLCVSQKLEHAAELRRRARDGRRSSWHRAILAEFCKYGCFCGVLVLVVYWVFYRAHTF